MMTYLIANYNKARYLEDCICSLHAQLCEDWRCIIVDDNSSDNSVDIIKPLLTSKIRLLRNPVNRGCIHTHIRLIEEAESDIVAVLDSDDAVLPETTEVILRAYADCPEAGFVYSSHARYSQDFSELICQKCCSSVEPGATTLTTGFVSALRSFRVSVYRRTCGLNHRIVYAEDRDLVYKMEEVTKPLFVAQDLYKYRQVPDSQSNDPSKRRIGVHSHFRAFSDALERRGVCGYQKRLFQMYFLARVRRMRYHSAAVRVGGRIMQWALGKCVKRWDAEISSRFPYNRACNVVQ